ncbi:hypothetical protein D3829_03855 [Streptococcus mutans]|nr:hypothetical protein [Streptococcus mutans]
MINSFFFFTSEKQNGFTIRNKGDRNHSNSLETCVSGEFFEKFEEKSSFETFITRWKISFRARFACN